MIFGDLRESPHVCGRGGRWDKVGMILGTPEGAPHECGKGGRWDTGVRRGRFWGLLRESLMSVSEEGGGIWGLCRDDCGDS